MPNITLEYTANPSGGEIATLKISRPEHLNALNLQTIAEIDRALDEITGKKDIRAVIVTGEGTKSFVDGADVKELETLDAESAYKLSMDGNRVFSRLAGLSCPTIAAVNGFAFGGGCELALACDIRLASENAVFALPEVTLGICPGWGGTQRLARLVGYGAASEIILSAARIDPDLALEIGLVSMVHPPSELMSAVMDIAKRIGRNAPIAVSAAKKAMQTGIETSLSEGIEIEAREFSKLFDTSDAKGGLKAFNNKQKYEFKGE